MGEERRAAVVVAAERAGVPLLEDNPDGDLWYDAPPPPPLAARWPEGVLYLGSFSKALAPGLRLGWLVAPPVLFPKLLQVKQAADLHTPILNQRGGGRRRSPGRLPHRPRSNYPRPLRRPARRHARGARAPSAPGMPRDGAPRRDAGVKLPEGVDATAVLPRAVERGVAYVPGGRRSTPVRRARTRCGCRS